MDLIKEEKNIRKSKIYKNLSELVKKYSFTKEQLEATYKLLNDMGAFGSYKYAIYSAYALKLLEKDLGLDYGTRI